MWQQSMQQYKASFRHFEWHYSIFRPRRLGEDLKLHLVLRRAHPTRLESLPVSARYGPQASVLDRRILESKPEPNDVDRFGVKKRAVLMTRHLTADVRLLEDVHRLEQ